VVPCHRVVPATGGIGKYGGSEWRKEYLLRLEGWLAVSR
jgi:methylated-DNA-[protein]-cysteine S-methyltransferase